MQTAHNKFSSDLHLHICVLQEELRQRAMERAAARAEAAHSLSQQQEQELRTQHGDLGGSRVHPSGAVWMGPAPPDSVDTQQQEGATGLRSWQQEAEALAAGRAEAGRGHEGECELTLQGRVVV